MSFWTYIHGTVIVDAFGRTQPEIEYILKTILDHLPRVTGSEGDMDTYMIKTNGYNMYASLDEFGEKTNNLKNSYGDKSFEDGWKRTQSKYIIVVDGSLRDRMFHQTFRELSNWLCRLAKRTSVEDVMIKLNDFEKTYLFTNDNGEYSNMHEDPSWYRESEGEPAWWEYLMWQSNKYGHPRILGYKYYNDEENDQQVEAWLK